MKTISTSELIQLLMDNKGTYIEASPALTYNGRATHFLIFEGEKIFDTGIDSQEVSWHPQEFVAFYPNATWVITQIVRENSSL